MKTFQVTLPDEFAAFVERVLAEKKWDTVDDLVVYALMNVQAELAADESMGTEALRKAVQIGIDQADRGELSDGPGVIQRMREKLEASNTTHQTANNLSS